MIQNFRELAYVEKNKKVEVLLIQLFNRDFLI